MGIACVEKRQLSRKFFARHHHGLFRHSRLNVFIEINSRKFTGWNFACFYPVEIA